jgi:PAS domain S-box-containing protein
MWPLFNGEGKVFGLLGISRDITENKQVQDKLRKSEERLSLVLEATQDGICDWDLVNDTMYYSPRCWQLVGYRGNELNTDVDLWQRLMHPEDSERINRVIEDAKAKKASFAVEGRFLHKDGHYVPILIRGFILRDNGGKAIRVSGTSTDLAEQKRIEAERIEWGNDSGCRLKKQKA